MKRLCLLFLLLISGMPALAYSPPSRITVVQADIMGGIKSALGQFEVDCGRYPTTAEGLAALINCPTNLTAGHWHGPYLEKIPLDPWGTEYGYLSPGIHSTNAYELYSCGIDGISKTQGSDLDDINNWDPSSPHGGRYDVRSGPPLTGIICLVVGVLGAFIIALNCLLKNARDTKPSAVKMGAGILSVFWLPLGFALFIWLRPFSPDDSLAIVLAILIVWWGGTILLALSGLRSGTRLGIAAGLLTVFGFLFYLWYTLLPPVSIRS